MALSLITDRTEADVGRVRYLLSRYATGTITADEITEFATNLKGSYNYTDLNRVTAAMYLLASDLRGIAGSDVTVSAKNDWVETDIPRASEMQLYLDDVRRLRVAIGYTVGMPTVPDTMLGFGWMEANDLEKILLMIEDLLERIQLSWRYAGEIFAGEV